MLFPISVIHYCACACSNKEGRIPLVLLINCSLHANCYSCSFCYKIMVLKNAMDIQICT